VAKEKLVALQLNRSAQMKRNEWPGMRRICIRIQVEDNSRGEEIIAGGIGRFLGGV